MQKYLTKLHILIQKSSYRNNKYDKLQSRATFLHRDGMTKMPNDGNKQILKL
jgi:hypothetical protein